MKLNLICPKCKRERKFDSLWSLMFGEERAEFQKGLKEMEKSSWLKELPERMKEIEELEKKAAELEKVLPQEVLYNLKVINQKIAFLYNHIKYKESI